MSAGVVIWDRMGKIFFVFFIIQIMFKKKSNKIKKWGIIKKSEGSAPMRNFRIFLMNPFLTQNTVFIPLLQEVVR